MMQFEKARVTGTGDGDGEVSRPVKLLIYVQQYSVSVE